MMGTRESATHCQWMWAKVLPASFQSKEGSSKRRVWKSQASRAAISRVPASHFHFVRVVQFGR
jgi:hypothetical protein